MRMSKSLAVLGSNTDTASPDRKNQARRRSSLDTFVIPGRTRLPSSRVSQPEPMDLRIAEKLLDVESRVLPRKSSYRDKMSALNPPKCRRPNAPLPVTADSQGSKPDLPSGFHLEEASIPQSRSGTLDLSFQVPWLNNTDEHYRQHPEPRRGDGSCAQILGLHEVPVSYDGPNDHSSNGSRKTTSTWTTISHRNFTSSSAGSQRLGSGPSIQEYNRLAPEHGLTGFAEAPDCPASANDHSQPDPTDRVHHHGWIVRKFLRRTSSTYNIKPRGIAPEIRRKRSVYTLSGIQPRPRKDILKDRTLEEISRLGGLSILTLPHDFAAVDKLVVPSCVSATAHYLVQHGCTTPGIFRVPGQLSTINALYDYYSNRFLNYSNIDDPDKIQSTVGTGDLPAHIEYTVHDVASLLKKILLGLPGGLLGSLSLFKAISGIGTKIQRGPEQSEADFIALKAKLIALAISCVTSDHRFSLICAILGLASLIGHESEKAASGRSKINVPSSELMGYRALGVVLGPLLLGDNVNDIFGSENLEIQQNNIPDSPKRSRKQKRSSTIEQKFGQNEALLAHVEKAKITAEVGEMLISMWRDIVTQLRDLAVNGTASSQQSEGGQLPVGGRSKFTLSTSQDGFIRGIQPLDVFGRASGSAKKPRHVSGYSRHSRSSRRASSSKGGDWLHDACVTDSAEDRPLLSSSGRKASKPRQLRLPRTDGSKVSKVRFNDYSSGGAGDENFLRQKEGEPLPEALVLTHPFIAADITLVQKSPSGTPENGKNSSSKQNRKGNYGELLRSKLLPSKTADPINRGRPEASLPSKAAQNQDTGLSVATDEFSGDDRKTNDGLSHPDLIGSTANIPAGIPQEHAQLMADSFGASGRLYEIDEDKGLLISGVGIPRRPIAPAEASFYDPTPTESSQGKNVKLLAQRFSQTSQGHYVPETLRAGPACKVFSNVYATPTETLSSPPPVPRKDTPPSMYTATLETESQPPMVPEKDTHSALHHSRSDLSRGRESLIPKPIREIGRGRKKCESRSPSPIKEATPATQVKKQDCLFDLLPKDRFATAISNKTKESDADDAPKTTAMKTSAAEVASPASPSISRGPVIRKALTTSSLNASSPLDALVTSARPSRLPSTTNSSAPSDARWLDRARSPSISQDSDTSIRRLSPALRTNTAGTSALYAEIRRLHRELEKKNDEVSQVRRSLDVVKEAGSARERSCSQDGSIYEDDTRKQLEFWKRRAEEAERKLEQGANAGVPKHTEIFKHSLRTRVQSLAAEETPRKILGELEESPNKGRQAIGGAMEEIEELGLDETGKGSLRASDRGSEAYQTPRKGESGSKQTPKKASQVAFMERPPETSSNSRRRNRSERASSSAMDWQDLL